MDLSEDIALVTGASRGIGRAIAVALADAGAKVIGTATSQGGADNINDALSAQGGAGMVLDVADGDSVDALIKAVQDQFGHPSILVNNAGITRDNLMLRMSQDEWDSVIQTNLSSVFRMSKTVLKGMFKARKGRIINIASVVASSGNPGQANYGAAKAGMIGFTRSLAREVGPRNITVNCVAPGFIKTDMTDALSDAQRDSLLGSIPLNRLGSAEEIAGCVGFLCSPAAAYVTGETLQVNGGMYMG